LKKNEPKKLSDVNTHVTLEVNPAQSFRPPKSFQGSRRTIKAAKMVITDINYVNSFPGINSVIDNLQSRTCLSCTKETKI
jgi:hypothetical protein